jgi:hypothetical protein
MNRPIRARKALSIGGGICRGETIDCRVGWRVPPRIVPRGLMVWTIGVQDCEDVVSGCRLKVRFTLKDTPATLKYSIDFMKKAGLI